MRSNTGVTTLRESDRKYLPFDWGRFCIFPSAVLNAVQLCVAVFGAPYEEGPTPPEDRTCVAIVGGPG